MDSKGSVAKILRIRFCRGRTDASDALVVATFKEPELVTVTSEEVTDEIFADRSFGDEPQLDELLLVITSSASASGFRSGKIPPSPQIEFTWRGDHVAWQPGLAILRTSEERAKDAVAAIVYFSYYEGELRRLERFISELWSKAERDAALTHQVKKADLARSEAVNEITRLVSLSRLRFARIEWVLENPAPAFLSGPSRQLVSELAAVGNVPDRMEAVDDRLEIFSSLYELANDRLSEFSFFWREYNLEVWILAMLVIEVVLLIVEAVFISHLGGG